MHQPSILSAQHSACFLRNWSWRLIVGVLLCTPASAQEQTQEPTPTELQPYRVCICVAFERDPLLLPRFRRELLTDIEQAVERTFGQMWTLKVEQNPRLWPANRIGLDRLSFSTVRAGLDDADFDKVFLLVVNRAGSRYDLAGVEWDAALQNLTPAQTRTSYERSALAEEVLRLVESLFRPILSVHRVEPETAHLRLRAGAFPAHDPEAAQLRQGDLLQPFFRYQDRDGAVHRIQVLPWTYLRVDSMILGRVSCSLISGLRSPLGTGSTRRVQQKAVRIRPTVNETKLKLMSRRTPSRPLIGYSVEVVPKTFVREESARNSLHLVTDRSGSLLIPYLAEQPLVWLYVRSGDALLARVPFAPGIRSDVTFQLPDDSLRLATEGELELLKGRLVDVVARRATLLARMRSLAREGDWDTISQLRQQLNELPGIDHFESQLTAIRVPALDAANEQRDRVAGAKIRRLCRNTSELINRYLDQDKLQVVLEEIDELRQIQQDSGTN